MSKYQEMQQCDMGHKHPIRDVVMCDAKDCKKVVDRTEADSDWIEITVGVKYPDDEIERQHACCVDHIDSIMDDLGDYLKERYVTIGSMNFSAIMEIKHRIWEGEV